VTAAPVPPGRVLRLPAPALVLLVGPAGVGKSTFARRWFPETAIVSSDRCRAWLTDDEDDQSATADAFELVHALVDKRLRRNRLTAVDATNLQVDARRPLLALAHRHQVQAVAVVFHVDPKSLAEQNAARAEAGGRRAVPMDILTEHLLRLGTVEADLSREDLAAVLTLESPEAARRPAPSTSSATCTAASTNSSRCFGPWGTASRAGRRCPIRSARLPGAARSSSAISSTGGRACPKSSPS
jgi:predicted kinase